MSENDNLKILWDFSMITDTTVACNRPDIVLFLKQEQCIVMFCPADVKVVEKEEAKVQKYQALASELIYLYEQPVDVIPVVFGHSGVVSSRQQHHLKRILYYNNLLFCNLQKVVLLGTISIMRHVNVSSVS